jgi:CDP-glucose 4,6-dehydratase
MLVEDGWLSKISSVDGSVTDYDLIRRTLAEYEVDTVFHLAAQTLVGVAKEDPVGTLQANVEGTWNTLEASRTTRMCQVLVASSDKAYGKPKYLPYDEEHPLGGVYPYDMSKSCVDLLAGMYASTYGLPVGITRCGNLFGGGDLNFSRTIPGLILATLRGEPFVIRSDGHYVRDFLYVEDAVAAYMLLAEKIASDAALKGQAFNFSLESRYTVLELTEMVLGILNRKDLDPVILNKAHDEVREQYLTAEKARQSLGWVPKFGFEEGLIRSIEWYRGYLAKQDRAAADAREEHSRS